MDRVDDADAAAGVPAVNRLGVLQIRVHPGGRIHIPSVKMPDCRGGVTLVSGDPISGRQRVEGPDKRQHEVAMGDEIGGIGHPVALHIGPVGIRGIGPPIIAFGRPIVRASRAAGINGRDNRFGLKGEDRVGFLD